MGQLLRDRLGERHYPEVRRFMGHEAQSTTDIYALPKPEHLGIVMAEIEAIIGEIDALEPGAYRTFTAVETIENYRAARAST